MDFFIRKYIFCIDHQCLEIWSHCELTIHNRAPIIIILLSHATPHPPLLNPVKLWQKGFNLLNVTVLGVSSPEMAAAIVLGWCLMWKMTRNVSICYHLWSIFKVVVRLGSKDMLEWKLWIKAFHLNHFIRSSVFWDVERAAAWEKS